VLLLTFCVFFFSRRDGIIFFWGGGRDAGRSDDVMTHLKTPRRSTGSSGLESRAHEEVGRSHGAASEPHVRRLRSFVKKVSVYMLRHSARRWVRPG